MSVLLAILEEMAMAMVMATGASDGGGAGAVAECSCRDCCLRLHVECKDQKPICYCVVVCPPGRCYR